MEKTQNTPKQIRTGPAKRRYSRVPNLDGTSDYVSGDYRISPRYIDERADYGEKATYWDVEYQGSPFAQDNSLRAAKAEVERHAEAMFNREAS